MTNVHTIRRGDKNVSATKSSRLGPIDRSSSGSWTSRAGHNARAMSLDLKGCSQGMVVSW
jgi:hypothetical protein